MKRIVGLKPRRKNSETTTTPPPPPPRGLNDIVESVNRKVTGIDQQIEECDKELRKLSNQMKNLPPGLSRNSLQAKARSILLRKKRYEQQAENLREKAFNVDSLATSISAAEDVSILAGAMKSGTKELKKELKKIDIDTIEDLQDDLIDLTDMTETVQTAMTRTYDIPVDIDDDELNTQLELLGDEIVQDNDTSYLDVVSRPNSGPAGCSMLAGGNRKPPQGCADPAMDEFGLPILNYGDESTNVITPTKSTNNTTHL